jgi:hypothetical protein
VLLKTCCQSVPLGLQLRNLPSQLLHTRLEHIDSVIGAIDPACRVCSRARSISSSIFPSNQSLRSWGHRSCAQQRNHGHFLLPLSVGVLLACQRRVGLRWGLLKLLPQRAHNPLVPADCLRLSGIGNRLCLDQTLHRHLQVACSRRSLLQLLGLGLKLPDRSVELNGKRARAGGCLLGPARCVLRLLSSKTEVPLRIRKSQLGCRGLLIAGCARIHGL